MFVVGLLLANIFTIHDVTSYSKNASFLGLHMVNIHIAENMLGKSEFFFSLLSAILIIGYNFKVVSRTNNIGNDRLELIRMNHVHLEQKFYNTYIYFKGYMIIFRGI